MTDNHLHPLTIEGIAQRDEQETPLLLLRDDMDRTLSIPIGLCEGLAIQQGMEGGSNRPLTHDLMLTLTERLEAPISRIVIDDYSGGTYYARMILTPAEGSVSLDCRPSDGIALAIRAHVPIFASNAVMTEAGKT